jgi:hypothetical protein
MGESHSEHNPVPASNDEALIKAERLAPLEEKTPQQTGQRSGAQDALGVDTGSLDLPGHLIGKDEGKSWLFGLEPVTVVIMVLSLAFIAFITYLIATEAPKPAGESAPATIEREP